MKKNNEKKFNCIFCNYTCSNKFDYKKHLSTIKHKSKVATNGNKNDNKNDNKFECTKCGKIYKFRSGLSRHKKKCNVNFCDDKNIKISRKKVAKNDNKNLIDDTLKTLTETLAQQGELIEKLIDSQNEMIPRLGNNNNNKISINVFLNEHCKEAISLKDFINSIKISLDDLKYTNEHGYVKGISNIFTKHLTDLEATQRPIHCSDKKRLQFYIKDSDKWERDQQNKKLDNSIQELTKKQIIELKQWEAVHPNYLNNNSEYIEWHKMVQNLMGGGTLQAQNKNTESIKKVISQTVDIKDAIKN
jgi:hypothetical protein